MTREHRDDVLQEAQAHVVVEGQDGLGMELDGGERQGAVLHGHDHAVLGLGRHDQVGGQSVADREQRVVASGRELLRQSLEQATPDHADAGGLAVHRVVEDVERAAEMLDHALQPEADAEDGDAALQERAQRARHVEVPGVPGPGDSTARSGARASSASAGNPARKVVTAAPVWRR